MNEIRLEQFAPNSSRWRDSGYGRGLQTYNLRSYTILLRSIRGLTSQPMSDDLLVKFSAAVERSFRYALELLPAYEAALILYDLETLQPVLKVIGLREPLEDVPQLRQEVMEQGETWVIHDQYRDGYVTTIPLMCADLSYGIMEIFDYEDELTEWQDMILNMFISTLSVILGRQDILRCLRERSAAL